MDTAIPEPSRIKVKKLGLGETTSEGSYWAEVDGEKVGTDSRAFWETENEAWDCGIANLKAKIGN